MVVPHQNGGNHLPPRQAKSREELSECLEASIPRSSLHYKVGFLVNDGLLVGANNADEQGTFEVPEKYREIFRDLLLP
jgi:hypothetical protein